MRAAHSTPLRRRPARFGWGVRLALVALALNALVPVHIAFDLAEALRPNAVGAGAEWRIFALLTGHIDAGHRSDHHGRQQHRTDCAVCNSLGTLAAAPPVMLAHLPVPMAVGEAIMASTPALEPVPAPAAAYRSRAPPLS